MSVRSLIRQFIYVALPLYFLQSIFNAFEFGAQYVKTFIFVAFAITFVIYLTRPILKVISFPIGGLGYIFLMGLVVASCFYALESFIPDFKIKGFFVPELNIFGIKFGNAQLEGFKALVFLGFAVSIFASVFGWIVG